jgi:mRNA interferase MazF
VAGFVRGDIVVVDYPNSASPTAKRRPALVVASWPYENSTDYLLSLISSQNADDPFIMPIRPGDVTNGMLNRVSYLRPTYLWACPESRITRKVCELKPDPLVHALAKIRGVFE